MTRLQERRVRPPTSYFLLPISCLLVEEKGDVRMPAHRPFRTYPPGEPAGRARLVVRVGDPGWVRRLLWRLGGQARVVSPDWLAREVRAGALDAARAYNDDM